MYKRSLLAYEGSAEGRTALREGALLARQCGAKVFLLSVLADYDTLLSTEADLAGTSVPGYGIVGCVDHVVGPEALGITDDRNGPFLDPAGQLFPHPRFCLALTYRCVHRSLLHELLLARRKLIETIQSAGASER
jgi:hypothetical protein